MIADVIAALRSMPGKYKAAVLIVLVACVTIAAICGVVIT